MHWLMDVDNTYGSAAAVDGTTKPAYINTYQRGPAGVGLRDRSRSRPATPSSTAARTATWTCSSRTPALRQAVEVHQRPRRRRARRPGRVLGATPGPRRRARRLAVAATVAKAAQDGRLPAVLDVRQVLQEDRQLHRRRARARRGTGTDVGALPAVAGTTPGAAPTTPPPAGPGGSATPATTTRLPEPDGGLGADQRTRRSSPSRDRVSRTGPRASERQLEFYTWLQSSEGAIAGGATNSWDGGYAHAAGRRLPPSTACSTTRRRSTTTRRPTSGSASRPGRWSGSRSSTTDRQRQGQGGARQVGAVGHRQHHPRRQRDVPDPVDMKWTGQPDTWNAEQPGRQQRACTSRSTD